jgi:cytochrome o ubiquinol oxidase subunit 2
MNKKQTYVFFIIVAAICELALLVMFFWHGRQLPNIAVLNPKGTIATQQRDLIVTSTILMLIVVLPVYLLTFAIVWKYREDNKKSKYNPDWDHQTFLELAWWAIPGIIISILAVITWHSSHVLDPFRPIASSKKPLTIQVVALQWKWLFIYPQQNIASVNYVKFPEQTPVNFEITSDAPMNSFWIPQLAGQVYAMSGMSTNLHLMADGQGTYHGVSANISGKGFAGMKFNAESASQGNFDQWVQSTKQSGKNLSSIEYNELSKPSENNPVSTYSSTDQNLYVSVVRKFMGPVIGNVHAHGDE